MDCETDYKSIIALKLKELNEVVQEQEMLQNKKENILQQEIEDLKRKLDENDKIIFEQQTAILILDAKNQELLANNNEEILKQEIDELKNSLCEKEKVIEDQNSMLNVMDVKLKKMLFNNDELDNEIEDLKYDLELKNDYLEKVRVRMVSMKAMNLKINNLFNTSSKEWLRKEKEYKKKISSLNENVAMMRAAFEQHILGDESGEQAEDDSDLSPIMEEDECADKEVGEIVENDESIGSDDETTTNDSSLFPIFEEDSEIECDELADGSELTQILEENECDEPEQVLDSQSGTNVGSSNESVETMAEQSLDEGVEIIEPSKPNKMLKKKKKHVQKNSKKPKIIYKKVMTIAFY